MSVGELRAVIDLGSNTFHLLLVRVHADGTLEEVCRLRKFVLLAENGVETIVGSAFQRGLDALREFAEVLEREGPVQKVRAIGTAALRTASNGPDFISRVREQTGIEIELIDGNEEARLISLGVRLAVPFGKCPKLIMDIGGGSVEYIIADEERIFWAQSFPIGVSVLYHDLQPHDPILPEEIARLETYLSKTLAPLAGALREHPVQALVGASGSFDVIEALKRQPREEQLYFRLPVSDYWDMYEHILHTTLEERKAIPGVPLERARLLVVAFILISSSLKLGDISEIIVSDYAMKEGALVEGGERG